MTHHHVPRVLAIVVFLALGAAVLLVRAEPHPVGPPERLTIALHTTWLALPIVVACGEEQITAHRVGFTGRLAINGNGQGTLAVHGGPVSFDAFGDPVTTTPARRFDVTFRPYVPRADGEPERKDDGKRRAYEILHAGEPCVPTLVVVVGVDGTRPHRLVVRSSTSLRRLPLHGTPKVHAPRPSPPIDPARFEVTGDEFEADRIRRIEVRRTAQREEVDRDPNYLSFDKYGDITMSTAIGHIPGRVTIEAIGHDEPDAAGRRRFRIVGQRGDKTPRHPIIGAAKRYELVLGPTEAGPHRLLVLRDTLVQIIPLQLRTPRPLAAPAQNAPPRETRP